jgi:nucleoside-diphosphate-sugar epimerase
MSVSSELHVVFGTGPLGLAVMRELIARGKLVRMVNRSGQAKVPGDVAVVQADAIDHASARQACKEASVVYNCIGVDYTKWAEIWPSIMNGIIVGAASANAKLIFADNLYMYGPVSRPMTEDLPYAATTRKGRVRAQIANTLMEAHTSGKVRATIGRGSDFYGRGALVTAMGERVFSKALSGKAAGVIGNLDMPHTYTYIEDFGRGLVTLGEHEEALGEVWHIPNAETITTRQFLELVFKEAGKPFKVSVMPKVMVSILSLFVPVLREMKEMLYEFEEPFIVDHSKFERAFGANPTPHMQAIRQTLNWFRQNTQ